MIPPVRELTVDEMYWQTIAIGLTTLVTEALERDVPLYRADLEFSPSVDGLEQWMEPLRVLLPVLVRRYRKVRFCDRVCQMVQRKVGRAVRELSPRLPKPIPNAISFLRNGIRVLTLEVPKQDERLDVTALLH